MNDIYGVLTQIDFFNDFSPAEIDLLLQTGEWLKFPSGSTVIQEGDVDQSLYVLVKGKVGVIKNRKVLAQLQPGDSFGEISALTGTPRTAFCIAHNDIFCVKFEPEKFDLLPGDIQAKITKKILKALARRLVDLNRRFCVT